MKNALILLVIFSAVVFASCQRAPDHTASLWKPYSPAAVQASVKEGKPVVVDFWADWCPNCHELDETVFSRADVQAKLVKFTALRMDVTKIDDPKIQKIINAYGVIGVPTVVFLDGHGHEVQDARVVGTESPRDVLKSLAMI